MERIISLMKEKGITKSSMSERIGIKSQNFNAMLKNPTYETLSKIASALDVPMWQLFASPDEAAKQAGVIITCPNCHHQFEVDVKPKE